MNGFCKINKFKCQKWMQLNKSKERKSLVEFESIFKKLNQTDTYIPSFIMIVFRFHISIKKFHGIGSVLIN